MAQHKLTGPQLRRIEQIREFEVVVGRVAKLVAELEHNRAGQTRVIQELCAAIAKQTSGLRQRALTADLGMFADVAGTMSVMAGRSAGINMRIRGLADGVNSLKIELEQAIRAAMAPPPEPEEPDTPPRR